MKTIYRGKGEVIVSEGEETDDAYVILDGEIEVFKRNQLVATLRENQIFGEIALVDQRPRTATCIAKTPVTLGQVTRKNYLSLLKHRPEAINPILRIVADRMRNLMEMVEEIATAKKDYHEQPRKTGQE